MKAICFLFAIGISFSSASVWAQNATVTEKNRKLLLYPLRNESGREDLNYLSTTITKLLASRIKAAFVYDLPRQEFSVELGRTKKKRSSSKNKQAIPLFVEALELNKQTYDLIKKPIDQWGSGSDYFVGGRFAVEQERAGPPVRSPLVRIDLEFFDAILGKKSSFSFTFDPDQSYQNLDSVAAFVDRHFESEDLATLVIDSVEPGLFLYEGSRFLGKSPLTIRLPPGKNEIKAEKEGFLSKTYSVDLPKSGQDTLRIQLEKEENRGILKVTSDPPGADVYLDMTYLGKTPLERNDLKVGTHRVRVSLPGYIDRFKGVQLDTGKPAELSLQLTKGDTVTIYRDPGYFVMDWTYEDLSFYSLLGSLPFYAGYRYSLAQADNIRDEARIYAPSIAITEIASLQFAEFYYLEQNRLRAKKMERQAKASAAISGGFLFAAGIFLVIDLNRSNLEVGEIGYSGTGSDSASHTDFLAINSRSTRASLSTNPSGMASSKFGGSYFSQREDFVIAFRYHF